MHFAAYRLKYSRWIHVVLVPNERVEALVRESPRQFRAAGPGVPLRASCSIIQKTVVLRHEEGRAVWNATLAQVAIDYGFTVELCTPYQPQQKGAVENLVGFVKRARVLPGAPRFYRSSATDLPQQLTDWLVEVNTVRPCRGDLKEIPADCGSWPSRRASKPSAVVPAEYGLRFPVTVGPHGDGLRTRGFGYAMPAAACGIPGDALALSHPASRSSPPGANMKRCMPASRARAR